MKEGENRKPDGIGKAAKKRINVKQAVDIAVAYLRDLVPGASDIHIEEAEISRNRESWYLTLSMKSPSAFGLWQPAFKRFEIDASTGEVLSMKRDKGN